MARKSKKAIKHLQDEEQRLYDALQEFEPGTPEYGMMQSQWEHSEKQLIEVDDHTGDRKLRWWHVLLFAGVTIATPLVGEGVMKIAQSPYTRDVYNRVTLGNQMPKPNLKEPKN